MHVFCSTEAPLTLLFFPYFATIPPLTSQFPRGIDQFGPRYERSSGDFRGFFFQFIFLFFDFFSFCFSTLNMLSAGSCLDVSMVAKVCRCVAQMPYFPSVACLELWFVGSLACRDHFLLFSGKLHQKHSVRGKAATRCYTVKWERIVHVMVLS